MNKKKIIIVGHTPNNINHIPTLNKLNYEITAFVDDREIISTFRNIKIINYEQLPSFYKDHCFFIALGDNFLRYHYVEKIKKIIPDSYFPPICDPSSNINDDCILEEGLVIGPYCFIGSNCQLKKFNLISAYCLLNHDITMNSYNYLGAKVTISGFSSIGSYNSIFSHSVISRKIKILSNVTIGTNSFVNSNIDKEGLYYGSPAKFIKKFKKNFSYILSP